MTSLDWKTFQIKRLLHQDVEHYYLEWLIEIQKQLHTSTKKNAIEYVDALVNGLTKALS